MSESTPDATPAQGTVGSDSGWPSARHAALPVELSNPPAQEPAPVRGFAHYFSADAAVSDQRSSVTFAIDGRELTMLTAPGVFSAERLDPGTTVMLREAPSPRSGTLLDLGCGYGPIGCVQALREPDAQVWAVDVNPQARTLAAENALSLGIGDRVHVSTPDSVPVDLSFDEIWSNPPIRIGKAALHELLLRWLPRLTPDGQAWLVVAKNLGSDSLQRWLDEQGWPTERHVSSRGYRVLRTRRP